LKKQGTLKLPKLENYSVFVNVGNIRKQYITTVYLVMKVSETLPESLKVLKNNITSKAMIIELRNEN
jgi:hypothetical protein